MSYYYPLNQVKNFELYYVVKDQMKGDESLKSKRNSIYKWRLFDRYHCPIFSQHAFSYQNNIRSK